MGARGEAGRLLEAPALAMEGLIGCVGSRKFLVQEVGKWFCTGEDEEGARFSRGPAVRFEHVTFALPLWHPEGDSELVP